VYNQGISSERLLIVHYIFKEKDMSEGKNVGDGQATVANVTISGQSHSALNNFDVVITLNGPKFKNVSADNNVTDWFTNMPSGLTAKVKIAIPLAGKSDITITVNGPLITLITLIMGARVLQGARTCGVSAQ
jgi:hypothetical protein